MLRAKNTLEQRIVEGVWLQLTFLSFKVGHGGWCCIKDHLCPPPCHRLLLGNCRQITCFSFHDPGNRPWYEWLVQKHTHQTRALHIVNHDLRRLESDHNACVRLTKFNCASACLLPHIHTHRRLWVAGDHRIGIIKSSCPLFIQTEACTD